MLKSLLALSLLCAPALADTPKTTTVLDLEIASGSSSRHYSLGVVEDTCSTMHSKLPNLQDEVKACMHAAGNDLRIDLEWRTRQETREVLASTTLIAQRGKPWTLTVDGMKLTGTAR